MKSAFIKQAEAIVRKGDAFIRNSGTKEFHQEAVRLLSVACLHEKYDFQELVQNILQEKFKTEQNFKFMEFSDFPLTVARGENCFIDLYFWRRRPTTVHNHHFTGAFQCLSGNNMDYEYEFEAHRKITRFHSLGELKLKRKRMVKKGDIEAINLLDKFIHQNHHYADLTVNLCFRTPEYNGKNLSNFLYTGLKYEKDQSVLMRAQRLFAFSRMDSLQIKENDIPLQDAICFLLETASIGLENKNFAKLRKMFNQKVKREGELDLMKHLAQHEKHLDLLEEDYL
jgi:hypothetical protein